MSGNGVHKQSLKKEISLCKQGGQPVDEYYTRLTKLWADLQSYKASRSCTCGVAQDIAKECEEDKIHQFLSGLDEQFRSIHSDITMQEPLPDLHDVYLRVIDEEKNISSSRANDVVNTDVIPSSVQTATLSTPQVKDYIDKLEDAGEAGGKDSKQCTLILTEGDSAKALVMSGLEVMTEQARGFYGVFPLQGKILNVKKADQSGIEKNKVIKQLKKIIGLEAGAFNEENLRYGKVLIMTDQDEDGYHIKGLIINLFHSLWPDLVKRKDSPFLSEFVTPLYKATLKKKLLLFYSTNEYKTWKEKEDRVGWTIKRYKGLGTNTDEEAREYFRNITHHQRDFIWVDGEDEEAIQVAFGKKNGPRRTWIEKIKSFSYLDRKSKQETRYRDFINQELILFSLEHCRRCIPRMVDGLKPSQRKTLFCSLGRNLNTEYKVSEFSAYVSENSDYHHSEQSIVNTIIKMAQDYVGRNNVSLLEGIGQFGTRRLGGKDAASARYIFTKISPLTRLLFHKDDDCLLKYLVGDNGRKIEPEWYIPIIPTVLVNGCKGVGSSYSTFVPNFSTKDIIKNIRLLLQGKSMEPMTPSYKGFKGEIKKVKTGCYSTTGVYTVNEQESTIRITELPINHKSDYRRFLGDMKRDNKPFIEDIKDFSTSSRIDIRLKLSKMNMEFAEQEGITKLFKLETKILFSNMNLFGSACHDKINTYATPEAILEEFFHLREEYYTLRHTSTWSMMNEKLNKLIEIDRFASLVTQKSIPVGKPRAVLENALRGFGFKELEDATGRFSYNYLLEDTSAMTEEKGNDLKAEISKLSKEIADYDRKNKTSLWLEDLRCLEEALERIAAESSEVPSPSRKRKAT